MPEVKGRLLCEHCGVQEAARFELTVFGAFDLRETRLCVPCQDVEDERANAAGPPRGGSYAHFGPIDFDMLRASIERIQRDGEIPPGQLRIEARELPRIAAAHDQTLPPDIRDFLLRHSA